MPEPRLLILRLSSMGDIVHALPAVAALHEKFPGAQIDWVVEEKWTPLLAGSPIVSEVIPLRRTMRATLALVRELRSRRYDSAMDLQGLYKSAALAWLSGAGKRIGFAASHAREPGAARFYTERVTPAAAHVVDN